MTAPDIAACRRSANLAPSAVTWNIDPGLNKLAVMGVDARQPPYVSTNFQHECMSKDDSGVMADSRQSG
jgi:hypothetical protein